MARQIKDGKQMRFVTDENGVLTGYVDDLDQDRTDVAPEFAAAVVGAAVTRINVGGSSDSFIVEV